MAELSSETSPWFLSSAILLQQQKNSSILVSLKHSEFFMNEHEHAQFITYSHYYTIQQQNLFLLMNASRNNLKASYKLHHVGEKKAGLTNYHVRRDKAAYAHSSLLTDVNTGWNPAWISLSSHKVTVPVLAEM